MTGDEPHDLAGLLAAVADGDRQAFARLYELTSPTLFAVARRLLRRADVAEDVLQEAFLQVWRNAAQYQGDKGAPIAWLIGIVRFRALDRLRRDPRETSFETETDAVDWNHTEPGTGDMTLGLSGFDRLKHCLEQLDVRHRDCILMAYYEGYTHSELAKRFDAPTGTVKSWIHRGLAAVRACMGL